MLLRYGLSPLTVAQCICLLWLAGSKAALGLYIEIFCPPTGCRLPCLSNAFRNLECLVLGVRSVVSGANVACTVCVFSVHSVARTWLSLPYTSCHALLSVWSCNASREKFTDSLTACLLGCLLACLLRMQAAILNARDMLRTLSSLVELREGLESSAGCDRGVLSAHCGSDQLLLHGHLYPICQHPVTDSTRG